MWTGVLLLLGHLEGLWSWYNIWTKDWRSNWEYSCFPSANSSMGIWSCKFLLNWPNYFMHLSYDVWPMCISFVETLLKSFRYHFWCMTWLLSCKTAFDIPLVNPACLGHVFLVIPVSWYFSRAQFCCFTLFSPHHPVETWEEEDPFSNPF